MTTIDRLGLIGIRSYGTDEETFIKFYKPLTIILGRNGSGKSTIIEAVKMATTGDLPPMVEKGAAFIHDPRIHNETETKAKIRLMFTNARGDAYVVSRHFQLALKKSPRGVGYKTEFKTLDQTVKRMDDGAAAAYRCADLNALLPDIMRVTKPVLNNVIFVHQEDSLWPLADSKKLKEKFDEIFAATRYTRALETIRKYRRDQQSELKTINVELLRYEDKVKALEKIRADVDEIRVKHDQLKQGIAALDNEIAALTEEKEGVQEICDKYVEKQASLSELQIRREVLETDKAAKYAQMQLHLPDMNDEALRTELNELRDFLERADSERSRRERVIQDLRADIDMKREEFHKRQTRKGMLQQQSKMQAQRKSHLETVKQDLAGKEFFSRGCLSPGEEISLPRKSDDLATWTFALQRLHKEAEANVKIVNEKGNESLDIATKSLDKFKLRVQEFQSDSKHKTEEIAEKRATISDTRRELRSLEDTEASILEAENARAAVERTFQDKVKNSRVKSLEEDIRDQRKSLAAQREDLVMLRRTREDLVQNQSEQARYDLLRETEVKKKKRTERLVEDFMDIILSAIPQVERDSDGELLRIRDELTSTVGLTEENAREQKRQLIDACTKVLAKRDTLLQQAEREKNEASAALKSATFRKEELRVQVDDVLREVRALRRKAKETSRSIEGLPETSVNVEDVTSLFRELALGRNEDRVKVQDEQMDFIENSVESVNSAVMKKGQEISHIESGKLLAESDLDTFENDPKHRCPACGLSSSKKVDSMRAKLTERVAFFRNPESLTKAKKELSDLELTSSVLKQARSVGSDASSVDKTYISLKTKLNDAEKAVLEQQKALERAEQEVDDLAERIGSTSGLDQLPAKRVELNQSFIEWEKNREDVRKMQESLNSASHVVQSLSEVEEQIRNTEDEQQKLQDEIEKSSRSLERERDDIRRAETRLHNAKQRCLELQTQAEKHKRLKLEKEELTRSVRSLESKVEELRDVIRRAELDLENAQAEYATVRAENGAASREASQILSKREMALHSWTEWFNSVDAYDKSGKEKELEGVIKSLETIQSDIETSTTDLRAHEKDQQTASDSQTEMLSRIRNLEDNQEYRIKERELQVNARSARHLEDEVSVLERKAGGNPPEKVDEIMQKIHKKRSERSATQGHRQGYTERYKERKQELEEAEKQGSRRKFDECRIRKQTMELALSDLEKYHRALDQALMAFHTLKMNSINRTIKELWQQTYCGVDIDEIEIISDHGDAKAASGGALKRTFNYQVQMRRGQATLDMRGRCSAGQKVLASLVIRLALAESFCTDCGILALDEPTTNLDRKNIASLADALTRIIETRRQQKNFQLVLITHDQEFIDMIRARDFCNEFFMIFKDTQGISRARVQDLQEM